MSELEQWIFAAGLAWASGIRLYAVLFIVGLLGHTGWITLPPGLAVLSDPLVLWAAGIMFLAEFLADKLPGFDSVWDAVHTFIRVPAGALLAAGAIGDGAPAVAAAVIGGVIAGGSHFTKAGSRALINTSPEPFSNWTASFTEDAAVLGALWLLFSHPLVFAVLLIAFMLLAVWLIPRLWRAIKRLMRRLRELARGPAGGAQRGSAG